MARRPVTELGDALVDVLFQAVERGRPRSRAAAEWVEDVVRPPRGARIVTDDGHTYSGVVVFERNDAKVWVAMRLDDDDVTLSSGELRTS